MRKLLLFTALCSMAIAVSANTITYHAKKQLNLNTAAFTPAYPTHTFANGVGTLTFNGNVTAIGANAFRYQSDLTRIDIPNTVTSIGNEAFRECFYLDSIIIPNSVVSIGRAAFYKCQYPISIYIPNSVTSIGSDAFHDVVNIEYHGTATGAPWVAYSYNGHVVSPLVYNDTTRTTLKRCACYATDVSIANSVDTISRYAFYMCDQLDSIVIPNSVKSIGEYGIGLCYSLKAITLPNSVTSLGYSAFKYCFDLNYIKLSDSLTTISSYTFHRDSDLQTVIFPKNLKTIDEEAFSGCISLSSITLPATVTSIEYHAFSTCLALSSITCYATTPPTLGTGAFLDVNKSIPVYVPASAIAAYRSAYGWNNFSNYYAIPEWTISVTSADTTMGVCTYAPTVAPQGTFAVSMTATANYGYHFSQWSDGNTDNPRTVILTQDTAFVAEFEKMYTLTTSANYAERGITSGDTMALYMDSVVISATANTGYQFSQWSDGNTDNPRTVILTQDTAFVAEFEKRYAGSCGTNLLWAYTDSVLTINGSGDMYDFTSTDVPWLLLRDSIIQVLIYNGATSIGDYAFYGLRNKQFRTLQLPNGITTIGQYAVAECDWLKTVNMGTELEEIKDYAFSGDERLIYVNCYAIEPPLLQTTAFSNYDAYLVVPCEARAEYKVAVGWKLFNPDNVTCIGAEETTTTGVTVVPSDNSVTITWPTSTGAESYTIEIMKEGVVFCTLIFNAQGQLTGIAFAPSRDGNRPSQQAEEVTGGYKFTVTSLDPNTIYNYNIDTKDAGGTVIANYTGTFTTSTTAGIDTIDDTEDSYVRKVIRDGRLYIELNGRIYDATGNMIR